MTETPQAPEAQEVSIFDRRLFTSFDDPLDTLSFKNAESLPVTALKSKAAKIRHVIVHDAEVQEEGKAAVAVRRVVLVDINGVVYSCVSEGILGSLDEIAELIGPPPWKEGLKLGLVEVQTRKGRRTYRLQPSK